jgi:hypothetical protein
MSLLSSHNVHQELSEPMPLNERPHFRALHERAQALQPACRPSSKQSSCQCNTNQAPQEWSLSHAVLQKVFCWHGAHGLARLQLLQLPQRWIEIVFLTIQQNFNTKGQATGSNTTIFLALFQILFQLTILSCKFVDSLRHRQCTFFCFLRLSERKISSDFDFLLQLLVNIRTLKLSLGKLLALG